ncbi:MAG: MBL fold metallo-hydrolase [Promethearchaeota archaeon]
MDRENNRSWEEVYPEIYKIDVKSFFFFQPRTNLYFIPCSDRGGMLYDAGALIIQSFNDFLYKFLDLVKYLKQRGILRRNLRFSTVIKKIIVSHEHFDHASAIPLLRKYFPKCKIMSSNATKRILDGRTIKQLKIEHPDLSFFEVTRHMQLKLFYRLLGIPNHLSIDKVLKNGEEIKCKSYNFNVLLASGHAPEQALLYEKKHCLLFSSDLILKSISTWLGPPDSDYDGYLKSMNEIRKLKALKLILPAHGGIITNPFERIDELIRFRRLREIQIEKTCLNKPRTINGITWQIYSERGLGTFLIARSMVRLVVQYLVRRGKLRVIKTHLAKKYKINYLGVCLN